MGDNDATSEGNTRPGRPRASAPSRPDPRPDAAQSLWQRLMHEREELERTVRVVQSGLRGLYRSQIPRMAAALSYRTLFSIIPIAAVSLLIVGSIVTDEQIEGMLKRALSFTGIDRIVVDDTPPQARAPQAVAPDATPDLAGGFPTEPLDEDAATNEAERLDGIIAELVGRVQGSLSAVRTVWVALGTGLVLIYAALSMLIEVERSFNHIYRAPTGRSWGRRVMMYWTLLTLGTLLLVAALSAGEVVEATLSDALAGTLGAGLLNVAVTSVITAALLTVLYLGVPNARVHVRPAIAGAVIAAIVWQAAKWGFGLFLETSRGYERLYGQLALLPLFLLWVYFTWVVLLFGLQVAYALQHVSEWGTGDEEANPRVVDLSVSLALAAGVARRFRKGKPASVADLAEEVGLPDTLTTGVLEALADDGILHRVTARNGSPGFALSAPPEAIDAGRVLRGIAARAVRPGGPSADAAARLVRERAEGLSGRSLAAWAGSPDEPTERTEPTEPAEPAKPNAPDQPEGSGAAKPADAPQGGCSAPIVKLERPRPRACLPSRSPWIRSA